MKELMKIDGRSIELPEGIRRNKIGWILRNACTDINYRTTVPELTVQELEFCLEHERRVTGRRQLQSELRRRAKIEKTTTTIDITPFSKWTNVIPAPGKERTHVTMECVFTCPDPDCGQKIKRSNYINFGHFQTACKEHLQAHKKGESNG